MSLSPEEKKEILNNIYNKCRTDRVGTLSMEGVEYPVDGEVGKWFDGHGITKGTLTDQMEALDALLKDPKKISNLFTAPIELPAEEKAGVGAALGTSGGTCYNDGLFMLVSNCHNLLKDGINCVVLNLPAYAEKEKFEKAYPGVDFVRMRDLPDYLKKQKEKADKELSDVMSKSSVFYDKDKNVLLFQPKKGGDLKDMAQKIEKGLHQKVKIAKGSDGKDYIAIDKPSALFVKAVTLQYNKQKNANNRSSNRDGGR